MDTQPEEPSSREDLLVVRCPECGDKTYYLVRLDGANEPRAGVSKCEACGYTCVATTGRLKVVEQLTHDAAIGLKQALEHKGLSARIEVKVRLEPSGETVRVLGSASDGKDVSGAALFDSEEV